MILSYLYLFLLRLRLPLFFFFFFFNDTATTEIYTLSLHDALPIFHGQSRGARLGTLGRRKAEDRDSQRALPGQDRKSTRLNSSHQIISYAVFCLKKKKKILLKPVVARCMERTYESNISKTEVRYRA